MFVNFLANCPFSALSGPNFIVFTQADSHQLRVALLPAQQCRGRVYRDTGVFASYGEALVPKNCRGEADLGDVEVFATVPVLLRLLQRQEVTYSTQSELQKRCVGGRSFRRCAANFCENSTNCLDSRHFFLQNAFVIRNDV